MNYHLTVNGVPSCRAPIYDLCKKAGLSSEQISECYVSCGYGDHKDKADEDAATLTKLLPEVEIKVVEGSCQEDPWWQTPEGLAMDGYSSNEQEYGILLTDDELVKICYALNELANRRLEQSVDLNDQTLRKESEELRALSERLAKKNE